MTIVCGGPAYWTAHCNGGGDGFKAIAASSVTRGFIL